MKNHIVINNCKIEISPAQAEQILEAVKRKPRLSYIAEGDTFKIGEYELVVLEQRTEETVVICKDMIRDKQKFGKNNNYDGSEVDELCNRFAEAVASIVGDENIVLHEVDLTSDDGLNDYGTISRRASLLTADGYRRYVEVLDTVNPKCWWWLAAAHTTERHGDDSWVRCVSPSGRIYRDLYSNDNGVRPFLILKSNIFVSK